MKLVKFGDGSYLMPDDYKPEKQGRGSALDGEEGRFGPGSRGEAEGGGNDGQGRRRSQDVDDLAEDEGGDEGDGFEELAELWERLDDAGKAAVLELARDHAGEEGEEEGEFEEGDGDPRGYDKIAGDDGDRSQASRDPDDVTGGKVATLGTFGVGGTVVPELDIFSGAQFTCTGRTGGSTDHIEPKIVVGNATSAGTSNSYLILDSSMTGNLQMDGSSVTNASLTLQFHGNLYLKGGDAIGGKGGIVNWGGSSSPAIPITVDSTSLLVDMAPSNTISLQSYIQSSGFVYLTPGTSGAKALNVSGDATHDPLIDASGSLLEMGNNTTFGGQMTDNGGTIRVGFQWTDPLTVMEFKDTGSASATIGGRVNKTAGDIDLSNVYPPPAPMQPVHVDTLTITGNLTWGSSTTSGQLKILLDTANAGLTSQLKVNGTGTTTVQSWDGTHGIQLNVAEFPPAVSGLMNGAKWTFFTYGGTLAGGGFSNTQVPPYAGSPANTYTIDNGANDQHLTLANPLLRHLKVRR